MYGQHGEKGEREGWLFQLPWHGWKPGEEITGNTCIESIMLNCEKKYYCLYYNRICKCNFKSE